MYLHEDRVLFEKIVNAASNHYSRSFSIIENFRELVGKVREHRARMKICPSARPEIDVPQVLREIGESGFFRLDYEEITSSFVQEQIGYEAAVAQLLALADSGLFSQQPCSE